MTQDKPDLHLFNQQLDDLINSDNALNIALQGDDVLLRVAAQLTSNPHPTLAPSVRQAILNQVVSHQLTPSAILRPNFASWLGRIVATLIVVIGIGFIARPVAASSIPGDLLYPIKLQYEQIELAFTRTPTNQSLLHLHHTQLRLDELAQLPATSSLIDRTWQAASHHLSRAINVATEHNTLNNNVIVAERTQTTIIQFNNQLSEFTLSPPVEAEIALAQTVMNAQLANAVLIIMPPASSPVTPEITPEVTEIVPEATEIIIPETSTEPITMLVNTNQQVNLRAGSNTSAEVIGTISPNTTVTIITYDEGSGWYQIELDDGVRGWIRADLLIEVADDEQGNMATTGSDSNANGNANGNSNGNANGNSNGNSNGNGNANGNSNGNRNGNSNGN